MSFFILEFVSGCAGEPTLEETSVCGGSGDRSPPGRGDVEGWALGDIMTYIVMAYMSTGEGDPGCNVVADAGVAGDPSWCTARGAYSAEAQLVRPVPSDFSRGGERLWLLLLWLAASLLCPWCSTTSIQNENVKEEQGELWTPRNVVGVNGRRPQAIGGRRL